jgi:hypothetical protein
MSKNKLYIILHDSYQSKIFEGYISHIDACNSHSLLYGGDCISNESEIIRLIETINSIWVTDKGIQINYNSGANLVIQHKSIA